MATRFGVRGGRELASALRELGRKPTAAGRRKGRQAAAAIIQEAYAENLLANNSKVTGALIESLGVAEDSGSRNRTVMGARRGKFRKMVPSAYSHFPEYGTAPHWQPNRFGGIMHPGARPKPALRPAYEQNITRAAHAYFAAVKQEIEDAAQRIASRAGRGRR